MLTKKSHQKIISFLTILLFISFINVNSFAAPVDYGDELKAIPQTESTQVFSDVPTNNWAFKYITEMVNKKVISGYPDGKFRPDKVVTRAEFAKIMVSTTGIKAQKVNYSSFSDIKVTDWHSPFVEAVKEYLSGYRVANGSIIYNPDSPALREDIAIAIVKIKGYDIRLADRSIIEAMFTDYDGISDSAKDYVALAVENGLMSGFPDETFRAQDNITRAEAVTLLWRAYQYGNDNKVVDVTKNAGTVISPTPQATQPVTTPQVNSTQTPISESNTAKLFSVRTLAGGNGKGSVDGPASSAKIAGITSMIINNDGNIIFNDQGKIREYSSSLGTVQKLYDLGTDFSQIYTFDKKMLLDVMDPDGVLAYDNINNKVYLLGHYSQKTDNGAGVTLYNHLTSLYQIAPSKQLSTSAGFDRNQAPKDSGFRPSGDFLIVGNDGGMYYSNYFGPYLGEPQYRSDVLRTKDNGGISTYFRASSKDSFFSNEDVSALFNNGVFYMFTAKSKTLTYYDFSSNKLIPVKSDIDVLVKSVDSVCSYNGKFYLASGANIYELSIDGSFKKYIDSKDIAYKDSLPITQISKMCVDNSGNIIFYDNTNSALRIIERQN